MKKIALLSLLALSAGTLTAQQINGTFDGAWETCTPYQGAGSYYTKGVGQQPVGWKAANIYQMSVKKELTTNQDGAAYIYNGYVGLLGIGQTAPGYLSLGTPWNAAKVTIKFPSSTITEKDGGTYGGMEFAYRPDALRFSYKRSHGKTGSPEASISDGAENLNENASVVAILWKGEFSSSVGVGVSMSGSPAKETMVDREKDVMGMITDGVTKSDDAECIATINYAIEGDQAEWKTLTIPFNYTSDATPEKINVIFSSADYFGDRDAIGAGNSLTIDNVELIYNSQLTSLTYDGEPVEGFAMDNYDVIDMGGTDYDPTKLAYTSNGAGATVTRKFDATGLLTLTVLGNDVSTNPDNVHTYQIQFAQPLVTSISVAGEPIADFDPSVSDITLPFPYDRSLVFDFSTSVGMYNGDFTTDDATETATLAIESGDRQGNYTLHFTDAVPDAPLSGTYGGSLSVLLQGTNTPLANAPIDITINTDGTANLTLQDFSFMGAIQVGDIFVPHIPVTDGTTLSATRTISFPYGQAADMLGELPVTVSATIIGEGQLEAAIDINTQGSPVAMFGTIHVDFTPLVLGETTDDALIVSGRLTKEGATLLALSAPQDKRYVDLSGATVDSDVELTDLFGENNAPNTLVYLPTDATLAGDNVIVDTECQKLVLSEDAAFFAPKAFTAAEVSFDRDFAAGRVNTFVLPFTFTVPDGISVTKLNKVEGTTLTFSPVTTAEANTPYLIETNEARPFDALTNVEVAATATVDVTVSGVTHHGAFDSETVTSGETTYYGWNENGEFVKATTGTLLPFRTYLTTSAAQAAPSFKVIMDKPTGIDTITTTETNGAIYDLTGRRVEKAVKGIYIRDGKKVYIK